MGSAIEVNKLVTTFAFKLNKGEIKSYEAMLKRLDKQGQAMAKNASKAMSSQMGGAAKAMGSQFGSLFKQIQRQANGLKLNPRVHIDNSSAKAKIKEVDSMVNGLSKRLSSMALGLGGGMGAMGIGNYIANAAGEMETAMTRLNTLVGPKFANNVFANLQKFAKDTPYELKDVMDMFVRLQGAGFDLMDRTTGKINYSAITKLGDLAAASNKPLAELTDAMLSSKRGLGAMVDNFIGMAGKADGDGGLKVTMVDPRSGKQLIEKDIKGGDTKSLFDFWLSGGSRTGVAGGMDALSKTLPGQMSTLSDTVKNLFQQMWKAGLGDPIHKGLSNLMKNLDELEPKFKAAGKMGGKLVESLQGMAKYAPIAAFGIGLLATQLAGAKIIAGAIALGRAFTLLKGMSIFALLGGWPMVIGAAAVAVGYLGYEIFKFATTGEGMIKNLSDKFPMFRDAVKLVGDEFNKLKPIVGEIWQSLTDITYGILTDLGPIAKDIFENWFIPAVSQGLTSLAGFLTDWRAGYESLKIGFSDLQKGIAAFGGDCVYWFENAKNTLNLFGEVADGVLQTLGRMYPLMKPVFEALRGLINWGGAGDGVNNGSGWGGGADMANNPNMPFNNKVAAQLVANAKKVYSGSKRCLNGVWQAFERTFGANGGKSIAYEKAYQAAAGLRQDKRFKQIKVTPEMLRDPNMQHLLHGAVAVYNTSSGFSKTAGHIEVWDMLNNQTYYGNGAGGAVTSRTAHMLQNAQVFIPVSNQGGGGNGPQIMSQGPAIAPTINQYMTFNGNVDPNRTAQGAGRGLDKALDYATAKFSYLTGK